MTDVQSIHDDCAPSPWPPTQFHLRFRFPLGVLHWYTPSFTDKLQHRCHSSASTNLIVFFFYKFLKPQKHFISKQCKRKARGRKHRYRILRPLYSTPTNRKGQLCRHNPNSYPLPSSLLLRDYKKVLLRRKAERQRVQFTIPEVSCLDLKLRIHKNLQLPLWSPQNFRKAGQGLHNFCFSLHRQYQRVIPRKYDPNSLHHRRTCRHGTSVYLRLFMPRAWVQLSWLLPRQWHTR